MMQRLLICTDLDRTLIPNGPQPVSSESLAHLTLLVARPEVELAYVSGRDRGMVEDAISNFTLPQPDYVVADVGTTIYHVVPDQDWQRQTAWEEEIASDWGGKTHADIESLLSDLPGLRLQEYSKQNQYKLSYYVPQKIDQSAMSILIRERLEEAGVRASLIWSIDEPNAIGLLDILPERATKYHAVKALMAQNGFDLSCTVFCGDSGNDLEALASPVSSVLVANAQDEVKLIAREMAMSNGQDDQLYIAQGNFMGMNGNYSAGILEGIAHYYPETIGWMGFASQSSMKL